MNRVFYYEDELNDDFANTIGKIKPLPKGYKYISKNIFFKLFAFFIYRIIVRPIAWVYVKVKFFQRFKNKKAIKGIKGGFLIYANHTMLAGDAFIPNILTVGRRNYIITGAETASLTCILPLLNALGMIPLGQNKGQSIQQVKCVKDRIEAGHTVTVYPEAHIWPYYTGIRPFREESFRYAAMTGAPVVCMTNCFQKKRLGKKPKVVTYIDGPFYPDKALSRAENTTRLRNIAYETMKARAAENSTYAYYEYRKKEN